MDEKEFIRNAYKKMYDGMIAKNEEILREVLDDSFVLVHMTGQSYVAAAVFGSGRSNWYLQQKCSMKKVEGEWKITRSVASTY